MTSIHAALSREDHESGAPRNDPGRDPRSRGNAPALPMDHLFRSIELSQSSDMVTTVRDRNGALLITDGPFAETKEQMLG